MPHSSKTVLITGASSGIGRALALRYARAGHTLILAARRYVLLETLAAECRELGAPRVEILDMDLSVAGAGTILYEQVQTLDIPVDILINNAGFGLNGVFHHLPLDRQTEMITLNIRTLTELCHHFANEMAGRAYGHIVNMASLSGFPPGPYMATYYGTKAYVVSFSQALMEEFKGTGVKISLVCPGPVDTEFIQVAGLQRSPIAQRFAFSAVVSVEKVADIVYRQVARGKKIILPGALVRLAPTVIRLAPQFIVRKAIAMLNKPQHSSAKDQEHETTPHRH